MKKNLILAALLCTITLAAHAGPLDVVTAATGRTAVDNTFDYAGFSMGINSKSTPTTNNTTSTGPQFTNNASTNNAEVNGTLTVCEGRRLSDTQALAVEGQLVGMNGHFMPAAQAVYYTSGNDMSIDHVPVLLALHGGVGARMGLTAGVDLVFPIKAMPTASIRTGFTVFQRGIDGAHGMVQAGLMKSF